MVRNLLRRLVYLLALGVAVWLVARWTAVHSDAFGYVSEKIRNSAEVHQRIGDVKDVKLAWFRRWHISYTLFGEEGQASFSTLASGPGGSADIYVRIRNERTAWRIVAATLDGEPVDLER